VGTLAVLSFSLFLPFLSTSVFRGVDLWLVVLAISVVPLSLTTQYLGGILVGLLKIRESCIICIGFSIASLLSVLLVLTVVGPSIVGLIGVSVIMTSALFFFYVFYMRRVITERKHVSLGTARECMNYGSKGYVANAVNFLNYRLNMYFLNFFIGAAAVGLYSISVGLAEMIWIVPSTIAFVLFPTASSMRPHEAAELTATSCRHAFLISAILSICALTLGGFAINLLYGSSFSDSYLPLVALLPGILMNSTGALTSSYLNSIGKVIYSPIIVTTELLISIVLSLLLIPPYGLLGAAVSSSISFVYCGVLGVTFFCLNTGIKPRKVYIAEMDDIRLYIDIFTGKLRAIARRARRQ
jgi:O-antigen/teichoic acid export membrane protein